MGDYTQTTWVDDDGSSTVGTSITATRLNNLEAGVKDAAQNAHASGTYASRPAAASANKNWFYYASDVNVLYRSDGSAWSRVASDAALGELFDFIGLISGAPKGALYADGSAISRTTYADLFAAVSDTMTGTYTIAGNGQVTSLGGNFANIKFGMYVSGPGIPTGTTVSAAPSGGVMQISNAPTSNQTGATITFSWLKLGDGSTTFNLPDARSVVTVGGMNPGGTPPTGLSARSPNATGGEERHTLLIAELPSHDHGGATGGMSANSTHNHGSPLTSGAPSSMNARLNGTATGVGPGWFGGTGTTDSGPSSVGATGAATHTHTTTIPTADLSHTHTIPAQGSGTAHNVMQPWLGTVKLVKVY